MNVMNVSIKDLKPYKNNPRINDMAVESVRNSIQAFGFKVPLVIDKDNIIVCGHTRLKAAKELGLSEVPCVMADDLDEEQIKAFRLADNKVSELSDWDFQKLNIELDSINLDMGSFGFDTFNPLDCEDKSETEIEYNDHKNKKVIICPGCGLEIEVQ